MPVLVLAQSTEENYIKTINYKQESTVNLSNSTPLPSVAQVTVSYMDGLGRPIQQVAVQQSATGHNIVTPIIYDILGRQEKEYLPVPTSETSMNFTNNDNIINDPTGYYTTAYGSDGNFRYSEKKFESSPLNRVMEQAAPGEDWNLVNGHTIKMDYQTNSVGEVKQFKAIATYNAAMLLYNVSLSNSIPFYPEKTLNKSIVKDENWTSGKLNTTEEFKNQVGQVVLKRTYNLVQAQTVAHDTYYIYDQFGNLSFVVPPLASNPMDPQTLNQLCYQYKYDARNRLVEKKLPEKEWEFIVYDKLDRVVATGPVYAPFENLITQNKKGWLITKYDALNRAVLTGWMDITTRVSLQTLYNSATVYNESKKVSTTTINGVAFNYTTVARPTSGYHILTVNYFDEYSYLDAPTVFNVTLDGENKVYYNNTDKLPKGLPTGSWVRVLQNSTQYNAEKSYTLYDKKGRPVRQYTANYLGGYTFTDSKLDFTGKPFYTVTSHRKQAASMEYVTREVFTYSDQDRLLTHTHQIVSHAVPPQLLSKNDYDEMGQLLKKHVGGTDVSGALSLQKVDYKYNIRGWLKSINDVEDLTHPSDPTDLFAFKINYDEIEQDFGGEVEKLYNGNIAQTFWKTDSDNVRRSYGYKYDNLNRLLKGIYQRGSDPNNVSHSYDETLSYDKNGNIITLNRHGYLDVPTAGMTYPIDDLSYGYSSNSNRLLYVEDLSQSIDGFKDGNLNGTDYAYDSFGNILQDLNKGITGIKYNHLNLPIKIEFNYNEENQITYLYNAVGVKLGKIVRSTTPETGTVETYTDYLSGFQYKNNALQFFSTAEGYVRVTDGQKFDYVYNYTDHLGNLRVSYSFDQADQQLKILEENHYYPFGLKHSNYNTNRVDFDRDENGGIFAVLRPVERGEYQYKYNGKELQDELGLNFYDYGARNYDAAIGRWMNIDPLAETFYHLSGYNYVNNNPINSTDPNGMWTVSLISNTNSNGDISYSLQFTAEKGDNMETLSKQLGISVEVLAELGELNGANINEGSNFGLSELSEVKQINKGINQLLTLENLSNCANLAASCNDVGLSYQYGSGGGGDNVSKLAKYIQVMYESVEQKDTKIGTIIHYRLTNKAEQQVRSQVIEMMVQRLKASGKTEVEIKLMLNKPEFKSDVDNATKTILVNERHYSVVVLKNIGGDKVQNIIQKTGTVPMERKVLPANVNEGANYIPTPIENTTNPYYNKR